MRAANSATRCPTPTARPSTTPICIVCCVIGDGEAETGPLATSWHSNKFLDAERDGAVLPILHLNGYKIANPTILARIPQSELESLLVGYGYKPHFVVGDDPEKMHQLMAQTLDTVLAEIKAIQKNAREGGDLTRPTWPMIVLRSPKGWTGPKEVDGKKTEGYWRSHQVPIEDMNTPEHIALLEEWMRSYKPEELFDENGTLIPELAALAPEGDRRMGANPHANGGLLLKDLHLPDFRDYAVAVDKPGVTVGEATRTLGVFLRDVMAAERRQPKLPRPRPRREQLQPAERRAGRDEPRLGRRNGPLRRPSGPRRARHGDPERAHHRGLAGRVSADRAARLFFVLRGVHPHRRFDVRPARQVAGNQPQAVLAAAHRLAQLPADLARLASGPQRLLAPGPRLH